MGARGRRWGAEGCINALVSAIPVHTGFLKHPLGTPPTPMLKAAWSLLAQTPHIPSLPGKLTRLTSPNHTTLTSA